MVIFGATSCKMASVDALNDINEVIEMKPMDAFRQQGVTHCTGGRRLSAFAGLLIASVTLAHAASGPADDALRLAGVYGCLACHGMERKQVGPGFAQIAARYQGDASAPARLAGKIREGGVGAWGRVIMPRQPKMTVAESETLARWVLAQPPQP